MTQPIATPAGLGICLAGSAVSAVSVVDGRVTDIVRPLAGRSAAQVAAEIVGDVLRDGRDVAIGITVRDDAEAGELLSELEPQLDAPGAPGRLVLVPQAVAARVGGIESGLLPPSTGVAAIADIDADAVVVTLVDGDGRATVHRSPIDTSALRAPAFSSSTVVDAVVRAIRGHGVTAVALLGGADLPGLRPIVAAHTGVPVVQPSAPALMVAWGAAVLGGRGMAQAISPAARAEHPVHPRDARPVVAPLPRQPRAVVPVDAAAEHTDQPVRRRRRPSASTVLAGSTLAVLTVTAVVSGLWSRGSEPPTTSVPQPLRDERASHPSETDEPEAPAEDGPTYVLSPAPRTPAETPPFTEVQSVPAPGVVPDFSSPSGGGLGSIELPRLFP